jgi:hypothetical protein
VLVGEVLEHAIDVVLAVELEHGRRELAALHISEGETAFLCSVQHVQNAVNYGVSIPLLELGCFLYTE